jgi:hypothetical protein
MIQFKTNNKAFILIVFTALCIGMSNILGTQQAEAATIPVVSGTDAISADGQCRLSEAIENINDQAQTNSDCSAGDGANDTITLPSGTITLSDDLPEITEPLIVQGAGKTTTTINADGNLGFNADFSSTDTGLHDFDFNNFTITEADFAGFIIIQASSINLSNVLVEDSVSGAILSGITVTVTNSDFQNNTSSYDISAIVPSLYSSFAGLSITTFPLTTADEPTVNINGVTSTNNSAHQTGINIVNVTNASGDDVSKVVNTVSNTSVINNTATGTALLNIVDTDGPSATVEMELSVDSVTIAGNTVTAAGPNPVVGGYFNAQPYGAGMNVLGRLADTQNLKNVTVANNTVTNLHDDQPTIAGFQGVLNYTGSDMTIYNATIVNNSVTQTDESIYDTGIPIGNNVAFFVLKINISEFAMTAGSSSINSIVAGNKRNDVIGSCGVIDVAVYGIPSALSDLTPTNQGNNLTDDDHCTGYQLKPNVLTTLDTLKDNGGFVPTIALLPGSPAIGAGGQVLGISTDARGIPRPSNPDVGAYQTVLGESTDNSSNDSDSALADTGQDSSIVIVIVLTMLGVCFGVAGYRRRLLN